MITYSESGQPLAGIESYAKDFHDTYERLAPQFGYETRKESAKSWAEVPEVNRKLMTAVCAEVGARISASGHVVLLEALRRQRDWLKGIKGMSFVGAMSPIDMLAEAEAAIKQAERT